MVQQLAGQYEASFLQSCTVYCSMEPCPMCAGALYWSGIGRIVFALDNASYYAILGNRNPADVFDMPCKALLERGGRRVEVIGPVIQQEAADFYRSILKQ
jgi:tRNA(Arg) A34 adenosine deaminase TadA